MIVFPRMTREERQRVQKQLSVWQSPDALWHLADKEGDRIGSTNMFNQSGLTFLTDALTAGEFGCLRGADAVS
jgi:hypothetical protein